MPDRVIFNVVIPWTDEFTGLVHPLEKLREWFFRTAELCGGGSEVGIGLLGLWYDKDRPAEENPVQHLLRARWRGRLHSEPDASPTRGTNSWLTMFN